MKLPKQVRQALSAYNRANKNYHRVLTKTRQAHERVDKKIRELVVIRDKMTTKCGAAELAAKSTQTKALESLITACDAANVPVAQLLVSDNPVKL